MDKPLKYRNLRKILRRYGIEENKCRGKGSHRMFVAVVDGQQRRYPVRRHSESDELGAAIVSAVRRRFGLTPDRGVSDDEFYG